MTPGELFARIRDFYVQRLAREFAERIRAGGTVITEPAYLDDEGNVAQEGTLNLPARADLIVFYANKDAEEIQVDTERMLSFRPFEFQWSNRLTVHCEPFQWNWCPVALEGETLSTESLTEWFESWFRIEEESGAGELVGAIHFMSDPVSGATQLRTTIDLGSAPVDAIEALLDAAETAGASKVTLGECEKTP